MTDEQIQIFIDDVNDHLLSIAGDPGYSWKDALADCLREPKVYLDDRLRDALPLKIGT